MNGKKDNFFINVVFDENNILGFMVFNNKQNLSESWMTRKWLLNIFYSYTTFFQFRKCFPFFVCMCVYIAFFNKTIVEYHKKETAFYKIDIVN